MGHFAGYLVLYLEDVGHISVVGLAPYMGTIPHLDELCRNAKGVARFANAALQYMIHV